MTLPQRQWLSTFDIGLISQCSCYEVAVLNDARNVLISFDVANIRQNSENGKFIKHVGVETIYPPLLCLAYDGG